MFAEFANTLLRKRAYAITAVLISSLLPLGAWFGAVIMSLVALRKGIQNGFIILLWCLLPSAVLTYYYGFFIAWESILLCYLVLWCLSIILRHTANWSTVLNSAAAFGILSVIVFYAWMGHPHEYWFQHLIPVYQQLADYSQLSMTHDQLTAIARETSQWLTGLQVAFLLACDLIYLAFARGVQAKLFNPGGLRAELLSIHLPPVMTLIWVAVWLVAWTQTDLAFDLLPVMLMPYFITGLSLVHRFRLFCQLKRQWLVLFYVLLIAFFPYVSLGLMSMAVLDSGIDLRKRFGLKPLVSI